MPAVAPTDPETEYGRRLQQRQAEADRCAAQSQQIALLRGVLFLSMLALGFAAWQGTAISPWWLLLPAAGFAGLMIVHEAVEGRARRARRAIRHYQLGTDRLQDRWSGGGVSGERYSDPQHPYSGDLDLFGVGSLFQLICRARTRIGEDRLAEWLSSPATAGEIAERQAAVAELTPDLALREALAVFDSDVHDEIDQNRLRKWAQETPHLVSTAARWMAALLGAGAPLAFAGWWWEYWRLWPFLLTLLVEFTFTLTLGKTIRRVAEEADRAGSGLLILARVLRLIEQQEFRSPALLRLQQRLDTEGHPPSYRIAQLHHRIQYLNNALQNQFFAPLAFLLCLPAHLLHAVESWRARFGPHIEDWFLSVGEFEALLSLSGYAFEHPGDPFPEILRDGPALEAVGLGHPLLPAAKAVRNDVSLGGGLQVLLVSGSNMSGKSTLLRTIGVNVVLALCGAPVRARRLSLSCLQVGAAMRIHDSLQQGQSLFYAVIARLKQIVDLARRSPPLLFLLDEILQGTNSHDRRLGAEGVIQTLVEAGAIGLVTTHDLALTVIADTLDSRARNIHFEDRLEEGKMSFDYQIRPGVVQRSNALELMRLMGLRPRAEDGNPS